MARVWLRVLLIAVVAPLAVHDVGVALAQPNTTDTPAGQPLGEPGEESPLLVEPQTPEEFFDAAVLMVKLARLKLAGQYLQEFHNSGPDEELLLKLRDEHEAGVFLRLARIQELQPLSSKLLEEATAAFRRHAADPERIDGLIADLSGSPRERAVAIVSLKNTGPIVVPRILTHLSAPTQPEQRDLLLETLTQLGSQAVPPLLGALQAPNPDLRAAAIEALGWLGDRDAVPHLLYPAFGEDQPAGVQQTARLALTRILKHIDDNGRPLSAYGAAGQLKSIALTHFRGEYPWRTEDDTVTLWSWRAESETVVAESVSPQTASLQVGTRLARHALNLAPQRGDIQALFLALSLASDLHRAGWENPLPTGPGTAHDLALTAGHQAVTKTLALSLQHGNTAASVAALHVLAQIATRAQLTHTDGEQFPIRTALNYPDQRVQFAASKAVLELDPIRSFRGIDRVVDILVRALNDDGAKAALVVDPNVQRGRQIAGQLEEIGYAATPVATGRDGFRIAAERGDVEAILLHLNCVRWGVSQTVANLRADSRTAALPIAVYGPESMRPRGARVVQDDPLSTYVIESTTTDFLAEQLRPFLKGLQTPPLTAQQRADRRAAAAFWLAHIAHSRRADLFDLLPAEDALIAAVDNADLTDNVLLAMSAIPSRSVQQQFQDLAVNATQAAEIRELAALHLAAHIRRFGLLLSETQVAEIKRSWQAAVEPAVSTALASVIGSLKPNDTKIGARLRRFAPVAPSSVAE